MLLSLFFVVSKLLSQFQTFGTARKELSFFSFSEDFRHYVEVVKF